MAILTSSSLETWGLGAVHFEIVSNQVLPSACNSWLRNIWKIILYQHKPLIHFLTLHISQSKSWWQQFDTHIGTLSSLMFWIGWILCPQRHLRISSKSKSYTIPSDALALSPNFLSTALTPNKSQNFMALNYWKNMAEGSGCHFATMVMDNIRAQCSIVWQKDPELDTKKEWEREGGIEREREREHSQTC